MTETVSLTKAQVPSYLVGSEFYNSLSSDDLEEFSIPRAFFKPNTDVLNSAQLSHLLHTMRFWGLQKLPHNIIELLIFRSNSTPDINEQMCRVLKEFDANFRLLHWYKTSSISLTKKQRLDAAVRCGREDVLEYVYTADDQRHETMVKAAAENGHLNLLQRVYADMMVLQSNPLRGVSLRNVAMRGHADCLRFLLEKGLKKDMHVCHAAAETGHLACLKLAWEHGLTWSKSIIDSAASGGHLDCMKFAQEKGCVLTETTACEAAKRGHVACLEYALAQGIPPTQRLCNAAASRGQLACLQLLCAHNCAWDAGCSRLAASDGYFDCLLYLIAAQCPVDHNAVVAASRNGHEKCLTLLLERGCEIRGGKAVHEAVKAKHTGGLQVLKKYNAPIYMAGLKAALMDRSDNMYLRLLVDTGFRFPAAAVVVVLQERNLPRLEYLCSSQCCDLDISLADTAADMRGGKEFLVVLHQYGCPWDEYTSSLAAGQQSPETLIFAHEHRCPWDARTTQRAIQCNRLECLKYALQHSCPCAADACDWAADRHDPSFLQSVHEQGCLLTLSTCINAAKASNSECLSYAVSHGAPVDPSICAAAASPSRPFLKFPDTEGQDGTVHQISAALFMLKHARQLGCPWDTSTTTAAARAGRYSALAYALQHGCPFSPDASVVAAGSGSQPCLKLLHEKGCAWDERVSHAAAVSGYHDALCLRYCVEHACPISKATMERYNSINALMLSDDEEWEYS